MCAQKAFIRHLQESCRQRVLAIFEHHFFERTSRHHFDSKRIMPTIPIASSCTRRRATITNPPFLDTSVIKPSSFQKNFPVSPPISFVPKCTREAIPLSHFKKRHKSVPKKKKKISVFREALLTFGMAAILFVVFQAPSVLPAYSQKISARMNPEAVLQKEVALEKISFSSTRAPLLPVAGRKRDNRKAFPPLRLVVAPPENRIIIPKIGKSVPIVEVSGESVAMEDWDQLGEDIQEGLQRGVVHYPGTAEPGEIGNTFITGHSSYYFWDPGKYKDVFARLDELNTGDEFTVFWKQTPHRYRIYEKKVVPPEDTSVLGPQGNRKVLTLMTCTPVGTSKNRLILFAEEIDS